MEDALIIYQSTQLPAGLHKWQLKFLELIYRELNEKYWLSMDEGSWYISIYDNNGGGLGNINLEHGGVELEILDAEQLALTMCEYNFSYADPDTITRLDELIGHHLRQQ